MLDNQLQIERAPGATRFSRYWAPLLAYAVLIFSLSSISHPEDFAPALFKRISDKALHGVEYAILAILCYRAFRYAAGAWAARSAVLLAILAATAYGLTDEIHQAFVPFRDADGWDLLTDVVGAAIGAWGWHRMIERSDEAGTVP
ncbi:MAG: VanZ family protein [Nitrospiraceae bacterium]